MTDNTRSRGADDLADHRGPRFSFPTFIGHGQVPESPAPWPTPSRPPGRRSSPWRFGAWTSRARRKTSSPTSTPSAYLLLPNTSGARDAEEAVRLARLARAPRAALLDQARGDAGPPLPPARPGGDASRRPRCWCREGFTVLPYIGADPVLAKRLEEAGAPRSCRWAPPSAPTGASSPAPPSRSSSNRPRAGGGGRGAGRPLPRGRGDGDGRRRRARQHRVAVAGDPAGMARAFRKGVEAGREAYPGGAPADPPAWRGRRARSPGFLRNA